jgi:Carboxymuconolactone decarboxylase family
MAESADGPHPRVVERYLDDALYYLRQGCEPCADRYFDRARRHGASEDQIEAVRAAAAAPG